LIPAVQQLQAEGVKLRLHLADLKHGYIPHYEMVDYYASVDVLLCTSEVEGTPNPVLEALAGGVPIVSTDVGIVPQAFGPKQTEFILRERSVECLKNALRQLACRPELFRELSQENLRQAEYWDWKHQAAKFDMFFSSVLNQRNLAKGEANLL
jgi:glycosyltransferase involved in cell wall biosynthesis